MFGQINSQEYLNKHLMKLHGVDMNGAELSSEQLNNFMCEICSKTFTYQSNLNVHMAVHRDEKKRKCKFCERTFRWASGLKSHLIAAHNKGGNVLTCELCGKEFNDKANFRKHAFTHQEEKPFKCEKCLKGFTRKDLCKKHQEKCL